MEERVSQLDWHIRAQERDCKVDPMGLLSSSLFDVKFPPSTNARIADLRQRKTLRKTAADVILSHDDNDTDIDIGLLAGLSSTIKLHLSYI